MDQERSLSVHCPQCGTALMIVLGPKVIRQPLQVWKCPWCLWHHRAMFDAPIKRVEPRADLP